MIFKNKYIFDGVFGLERETLRVNPDGSLSQTPHLFKNNPNLERDFCENQLELITPVYNSIDELMQGLQEIDSHIKFELKKKDEYLWMYSNPPHFNTEDDIPVAAYDGNQAHKRDYRLKLARRYGKRLMLYSGIHFNFSFPESFFLEYGSKNVQQTKNNIYFELTKKVIVYSWVLVLLTSASPIFDASMICDNTYGSHFEGYASCRNSKIGYWNKFIPILDYSNLEAYTNSVDEYVKSGMLFSPAELYLPVRPKAKETSGSSSLTRDGINHIELRMTDVNPLSTTGVFAEDLKFEHYFLIYLMTLPNIDLTPQIQKNAIQNHKNAALFNLSDVAIDGEPILSAAEKILKDMYRVFCGHEDIISIIDFQLTKLTFGNRYCNKIYNLLVNDYQNNMIKLFKSQGTWQ